ncbi:hypothetical protein B9T07_03990 [Limnospira fusiformis CCALA 023]|uniref:cupin-like domain-containing protein n=1 Tax=Arthrospira sp. PCC 8006 TaxID=1982224 RepID=UPI00396DE4D7
MTQPEIKQITLPPLNITIHADQKVSLEWLHQQPLPVNNQPPSPKLSDHWQQWIAVNKLMDFPDHILVEKMVEQGIDIKLALEAVNQATSHPYLQAGKQFVQLLQKVESMLTIQSQLASLSEVSPSIDRKPWVSRSEFLESYYSQNTPLILTDIMKNWRALELWTPEYLKQNYGQATVEIQAGREADPDYEINLQRHQKTVLFADYIDSVVSGKQTNDYYMVANNRNLDRPELKGLLNDLEIFTEYLDPTQTSGCIFFWYGPAGTVTPLHHDPVNLLLAQVSGRKLVRMIPPYQTPFLYNYIGVFSQVDLENPDYQKYPLFQNVRPMEFILEPGEVIFIPVGWWHHVRSLEPSISVSMTNFVFPNTYEWKYPQVKR